MPAMLPAAVVTLQPVAAFESRSRNAVCATDCAHAVEAQARAAMPRPACLARIVFMIPPKAQAPVARVTLSLRAVAAGRIDGAASCQYFFREWNEATAEAVDSSRGTESLPERWHG